tara:strand:+ start:1580 stop:1753 length:174 start_codon:yes stop_codon:yes gene_type:complete
MFKVGDAVRMSPFWKYEVGIGIIERITPDFIIVKWEGVPGQWHYTEEQAERLELVDD